MRAFLTGRGFNLPLNIHNRSSHLVAILIYEGPWSTHFKAINMMKWFGCLTYYVHHLPAGEGVHVWAKLLSQSDLAAKQGLHLADVRHDHECGSASVPSQCPSMPKATMGADWEATTIVAWPEWGTSKLGTQTDCPSQRDCQAACTGTRANAFLSSVSEQCLLWREILRILL